MQAIGSLSKLPCIPVHCSIFDQSDKKVVLVKPDCVLQQMSADEKQFHPYLHCVPSTLNIYNVGQTIGIKYGLTLHHMQIVLEKLFTNTCGEKLDSNAKKYAKKAIECLGAFLRHNSEHTSQVASDLSPLYLPDTNSKLKLSTTLLYNDNSYMGPVKICLKGTPYYHFNITEDEYGIDAKILCQMLPEKVRPLGMSTICQQVPDEEYKEVKASKLSKAIQKCLQESDPVAVAKVFKKYIHKDVTKNEITMRIITRVLSSLKVITVFHLKTQIVLKELDIVVGKVASEFYLDWNVGTNPVLYIDSNLDDDYEIFREISEQLCQRVLESMATAGIEESTKKNLLKTLVNYLRVSTISKKLTILMQYQIEAVVHMKAIDVLFELGTEIPECYHHHLIQDLHNPFHPMEIVCYEDYENHFIVAQVVHLVRADQEKNASQRMYRIYTSKTDHDQGKLVSVLDLYKFLVKDYQVSSKRDPDYQVNPSSIKPISQGEEISTGHIRTVKKSLHEKSYAELKKVTYDELVECWDLGEPLCSKGLRRLYLKWHPYKNLDNQQKATEMSTFLKEQIEIKDGLVEGSLKDSIADSYPQWDLTARCRCEASHLDDSANLHLSLLVEKLKKNPEEGKRWLRQAEIDFNVLCMIHSGASTCIGYSHVCFMAHQVAEKALKGAVYTLCGMDGRDVTDHKLAPLIGSLRDACPKKSLAQFEILDDYFEKTRYPNHWPRCVDAPSEKYSDDDAMQAKGHAETLLGIIKALIP